MLRVALRRLHRSTRALVVGKTGLPSVVKKEIRVYRGNGVSPGSYRMFYHSLDIIVDRSRYEIRPIDSHQLDDPSWMANTAALIFPGGADIPFLIDLSSRYGKYPNSNLNIKTYVESGGSYLGVCAGSYYGASEIEFDIGGPLQVRGTRELSFFRGKAVGPVHAGFDYHDETGARAVRVRFPYRLLNGHIHTYEAACYYYGGGFFVPYDLNDESWSPLGFYSGVEKETHVEDPIAAIRCQVGKGVAVLCGPHPEYDPELMKAHIATPEFISMIDPALKALFLSSLLETCGIHTNKADFLKQTVTVEDAEDDWVFH